MKRASLLLLFGLILGWLAWPARDLEPWHPPPTAALDAPRVALESLRLAAIPASDHPGIEDLTHFAGRLVGGSASGHIVALDAAALAVTPVVDTGGRPLGVRADPSGRTLWITDAFRGLLRWTPGGAVEVVIPGGSGAPLRFANGLDVAADGSVYLTDSSRLYGPWEVAREVIAHRATGRLLRYEPVSGELEVLAEALHFANGVLVDPAERWALVAETSTYRVSRIWLQGARAGSREPVLEGLPGLPDNLFTHDHCRYWVALFQPRNGLVDALLPHPLLRAPLLRIPPAWLPVDTRPGSLLAFDLAGAVHARLVDGERRFSPASGGHADGESLYVGSLVAPRVGVVTLPEGLRQGLGRCPGGAGSEPAPVAGP